MEYNNQDVRRQDRLLDETRAFEILRDGEYGILSMQSEDGNGAYGIPINYVWDRGNSIYIHCAPGGPQAALHRRLPQCFVLRDGTEPRHPRQVHYGLRKRGTAMHGSPQPARG